MGTKGVVRPLLAVAVILLPMTVTSLFTERLEEQQALWATFKEDFKRPDYSVAEDKRRFDIFLTNLKLIDERNALEKVHGGDEHSMPHGLTDFADVTQEDFEDLLLRDGLVNPPPQSATTVDVHAVHLDGTLSLDQDWTGKLTTPVRSQGAMRATPISASTACFDHDGATQGVSQRQVPQ